MKNKNQEKQKNGNFKSVVSKLVNGTQPAEDLDAYLNREQPFSKSEESVSKKASVPTEPIVNAAVPAVKVKSTTTITQDSEIKGDLKTEGNIDIFGTVIGNVTSKGHVMVSGTIQGNVVANSLTLAGGKIAAETVNCETKFLIEKNSTIISDISSTDIEINAAIEGNISVHNYCILHELSDIHGDLTAKTISVEAGAGINGRLTVGKSDASKK